MQISPTTTTGTRKRLTALFCDITNFPLQWLINIGLATIWVLVVYLVPFEDCPAGYLGPGKRISMVLFSINCFLQVVYMKMVNMKNVQVE